MTRGTPSHSVAVTMAKTSLGTPEAKVTDCSDYLGHAVTYYKSGEPAAGESPGQQAIYAQVQPFDGTWKVTYPGRREGRVMRDPRPRHRARRWAGSRVLLLAAGQQAALAGGGPGTAASTAA